MNRQEGLLTGGKRGETEVQPTISFMPDADGTHVHTFESSQLEVSYVGDFL